MKTTPPSAQERSEEAVDVRNKPVAELLLLGWPQAVQACRTLAAEDASQCAALVRVLIQHKPQNRLDWVAAVLRKQIPVAAWLAALAGGAIDATVMDLVAREFFEWLRRMPQAAGEEVAQGFPAGPLRAQVSEMLRVHRGRSELHPSGTRRKLGLLRTALTRPKRSKPRRSDTPSPGFSQTLDELRDRDIFPVPDPAVSALSDGSIPTDDELLTLVRQPPRIQRREQRNLFQILRAGACELLAARGVPGAQAALIDALSDRSLYVRQGAARGLGSLRAREALGPLVKQLAPRRSRDNRDRAAAATALGLLGDPAATAPLASALDDWDPEVRKAAVEALATLESPAALGALRKAMSDPDAMVRLPAARALLESDAGNALVQLVADAREELATGAIEAPALMVLWTYAAEMGRPRSSGGDH